MKKKLERGLIWVVGGEKMNERTEEKGDFEYQNVSSFVVSTLEEYKGKRRLDLYCEETQGRENNVK